MSEPIARVGADWRIEVVASGPGLFRATVRVGDVVRAGGMLGYLEVLGRLTAVVAPATAHGAVVAVIDPERARTAAAYGSVLVTLDPTAGGAAGRTGVADRVQPADGLVFRAPTSGRYYGRPSPDKPAFLAAGDELGPGATICLLEVMKTFNRVTYGGPTLPERARVRALLVADGADVNAGDPMLALDPIS